MGSTRKTVTLAALLCALGLKVSFADAQATPEAAPQPVQAPPASSAAAPASPTVVAPAIAPAAPAAPAGDAGNPPTVDLVPAVPPVPTPPVPPLAPATGAQAAPPLSAEQFGAPPQRVVFLVPQKRAVRPRPVYGDAGAPFAVGMGMQLSWPDDRGYGIASIGQTQRRFDLFAGYDVWQPTSRVVISAGAEFRTLLGGDEARAEIHERSFLGDLTVRYTLTPWLFPHVRAAGGASRMDVSIRDEVLTADGDRGVDYTDADWAALGQVGAGFTLRTKARTFETRSGHVSSLSFGLLVEGGYSLSPALKTRLAAEDSPSSGVALTTAKFGTLERSAPYLRVAAVARF